MRYLDLVDPQDVLLDGDEVIPGIIYQDVPAHCNNCGRLTHTFDICYRVNTCSSECREQEHITRREAYEAAR